MPPFPQLSPEDRLRVLELQTVYPKYPSLASKDDMTPDVEYDQKSGTKALNTLKDNPDIYVGLGAHDSEHPNLRAVLETLGTETAASTLGLNKAWGFVLERNNKFYLKVKNLNATSDRVALIRVDPLYYAPKLLTQAPLPPPNPRNTFLIGGALALMSAYWFRKLL